MGSGLFSKISNGVSAAQSPEDTSPELRPGYFPLPSGLQATQAGASSSDSDAEASQALAQACPLPRCFFALGSPLGMRLSIQLSKQGQSIDKMFRGLDLRWPPHSTGQGWRFYNLFHPDDPIAYRIEPLLNPEYATI